MNEGNLLHNLNGIVTGTKFLREIELPLNGHIRASDDYLPLVTGDAPTWVEDGISFADGDTVFLDFSIPQDYEQGLDLAGIRLHLMPAAAHATDTSDMGVTTAQSIYRDGVVEITTTRTAVAETAVASVTKLIRESVLDISGSGYRPGDHVRLTLDVNATSTELILLGIDFIYSGTVAAYNEDDRYRDLS